MTQLTSNQREAALKLFPSIYSSLNAHMKNKFGNNSFVIIKENIQLILYING
jgi:hypothetical protein